MLHRTSNSTLRFCFNIGRLDPLPLVGRGRGGDPGVLHCWGNGVAPGLSCIGNARPDPHPRPSPQGGGETYTKYLHRHQGLKRFSSFRQPVGLLAASLLLLASSSLASAEAPPTVDPSIGHVDVLLDLPKDVPYVGEMILLRMRSTIRADIALDSLQQPPFTNFNWQQLGRDKPIRVMVDGFNVPGFERDIAIFPQQAGRLIIDPFIRHVTLVVGANQRVEADFASKPVYMDVQRHEGISKAGEWWLPAKSVMFKETWSPRPDEIEPGKVARRIVVLEAAGTTADRLPPPPVMRAPGMITFTGPATRETILTADGPIARATYQWDVRPVSNSPAKLPAIHVPWFDIGERRMRDTAIPDQWVGYVGADGPKLRADLTAAGRFLATGPLIAGLAGFAWMVALGWLVLSARSDQGLWASLRKPRPLRALSRAARRGDARAVKAALMDLARLDPVRWRAVASADAVARDLAVLDAALFGKAQHKPPALKPFAGTITRLWRAARGATPDGSRSALLPLDGSALVQKPPSPRLSFRGAAKT